MRLPEKQRSKGRYTPKLRTQKSSLSQLVLRLINPLTAPNTQQPRPSTALQPRLNINHAIKNSKNDYLEHRGKEINTQSKLKCYQALKTEYELEENLLTVRDTEQRQILTKYRLSDHCLATERVWLPREERRVVTV